MTTDLRNEVALEFLDAFAGAWNRHDVDALMGFMTDDCVFEASAGPEACGATCPSTCAPWSRSPTSRAGA